jgi:FkbM family methyltransferase
METKIFEGSINGIDLKFIDLTGSGTPSCVFNELQYDYYGLNQVYLSENDTVIDIGANIGMFSIYVKKKFNCNIIAFEPVLLNFEHFKKNIELNGLSLDDLELHNTAIASIGEQIINIGTPMHNSGGSSIFYYCDTMSECKTETLHKYINKTCTYLKVDTEGAEYDIIPSIINDLNKFKYIGIEYHTFNSDHNPTDLHNLIKSNFQGKVFGEPSK